MIMLNDYLFIAWGTELTLKH